MEAIGQFADAARHRKRVTAFGFEHAELPSVAHFEQGASLAGGVAQRLHDRLCDDINRQLVRPGAAQSGDHPAEPEALRATLHMQHFGGDQRVEQAVQRRSAERDASLDVRDRQRAGGVDETLQDIDRTEHGPNVSDTGFRLDFCFAHVVLPRDARSRCPRMPFVRQKE